MKLVGPINHYRADLSGWIGSVVMFIFALFATYRWHTTGLIFFALLVVRDLAASWFLLSRNPSASVQSSVRPWRLTDLLAYISSALPLLYLPAESASSFAALASTLLAIAGFTISTLALLDLGTSFGVAPANRGIVRSGLYRYLRHPMYAGYVIAEVGFVLLNPVNAVILAASFFFYILRAKLENRIFD